MHRCQLKRTSLILYMLSYTKIGATYAVAPIRFYNLAQELADLARTVADNYVVHLWCFAVLLVVALLSLSNEDLVQLLLNKVDCATAEATTHHT